MKGNKIAIDRYLETGEVVDSLDLSVNYLVKSVKEGGTVPSNVKNKLTWSKVQMNPSSLDLIEVENTDSTLSSLSPPSSDYSYIYKVDGTGYTSMANLPFYDNKSLYSIELTKVSSIEDFAFFECIRLKSVNFPNVTSIGTRSFYDCYSITSLSIPKVQIIGNGAFEWCQRIETVYLPKVTSIGSKAFSTVQALTEIIVGTEVSTVCTLANSNAFENTRLTSIYVPDALVNDYKSASNWSTYADKIKGISERPTA